MKKRDREDDGGKDEPVVKDRMKVPLRELTRMGLAGGEPLDPAAASTLGGGLMGASSETTVGIVDSSYDTANGGGASGQVVAPKVTVDEAGNIVIDSSSLTRTTATGPTPREESADLRALAEQNRSKRKRGPRTKQDMWTTEQTELFFRALAVFGTDFSLMERVFRKEGKDRRQLKNKYKKEDRVHHDTVAKILANQQPLTKEWLMKADIDVDAQSLDSADGASNLLDPFEAPQPNPQQQPQSLPQQQEPSQAPAAASATPATSVGSVSQAPVAQEDDYEGPDPFA